MKTCEYFGLIYDHVDHSCRQDGRIALFELKIKAFSHRNGYIVLDRRTTRRKKRMSRVERVGTRLQSLKRGGHFKNLIVTQQVTMKAINGIFFVSSLFSEDPYTFTIHDRSVTDCF